MNKEKQIMCHDDRLALKYDINLVYSMNKYIADHLYKALQKQFFLYIQK